MVSVLMHRLALGVFWHDNRNHLAKRPYVLMRLLVLVLEGC